MSSSRVRGSTLTLYLFLFTVVNFMYSGCKFRSAETISIQVQRREVEEVTRDPTKKDPRQFSQVSWSDRRPVFRNCPPEDRRKDVNVEDRLGNSCLSTSVPL